MKTGAHAREALAPNTGRGGNQWTSPDGCLMFTAGRRLKVPGSQAPFINYLTCLAVVRGVADAAAPWLKVRWNP